MWVVGLAVTGEKNCARSQMKLSIFSCSRLKSLLYMFECSTLQDIVFYSLIV